MIALFEILIASKNKGKLAEFDALFSPLNIKVNSLLDFPEIQDVEETGSTFEENAKLKAETIAQLTKQIVLSDDSGLCVDALNGAPGVYSARYAGEPSDSTKNNLKLLKDLENEENRQAHFVCCLVVAHPKMPSLVVEGKAFGEILHDLTGDEGFGYDPLFYVASEQKTFAQMSKERKNQISHRANALKVLLEKLPKWLEELKTK